MKKKIIKSPKKQTITLDEPRQELPVSKWVMIDYGDGKGPIRVLKEDSDGSQDSLHQ